MNEFTTPRWIIAFLSALLFSSPAPLYAQSRYALDADPPCRGEVPADPAISPTEWWTAEGWVYLDDDAVADQVILKTVSQPDNFFLGITDGRAIATLTWNGAETLSAVGNTPLPLGAWAHIAVTVEPSGMRLFLNGRQDVFNANPVATINAPGPLYINTLSPVDNFRGWIDQIRLSDTVRYDEDFDPFNLPLEDLRVEDQEVPGWELGTDPGDLQVAWDYTSLYDIIDGGAEIYINHNFQYAVQQYYYGIINDSLVTLKLWMTDQGTPEDAAALYHDPNIAPFFYEIIDSIGEEARLDTYLLFDWDLDFWRDRYYVDITLSKEYDPDTALAVALNFATIADTNIINRDLLPADAYTAALWYFDEGSGTVFYDASGNGHNGTLSAPNWVATTAYEPLVYITSAEVLEGNVQVYALDQDDTARITFSDPLTPLNLNAGNIDGILEIASGNSWLSGSGELGSVTWNDQWDTLKISFSFDGGAPTLASNDQIIPNPDRIISAGGLPAGGYRYIRFEVPAGVTAPPKVEFPQTIRLDSPFPTPFNAATQVCFFLPERAEVILSVFDISGRRVAVLKKGTLSSGEQRVLWQAGKSPSGIYFFDLQVGADHYVQKMVLLK